MKLYSIQYIEDMQWVINIIQNLYKENIKTECLERLEYFRKFALFTDYFFKILLFFYISTVSTCFVYPFFVYFTQNEVVPIMPLYVPYVDESTVIGFTIISIYHVLMVLLASFGISATDFFLAIIIISSLMFAKLITLELRQIQMDLQEKCSEIELKARFRNILRMHKEMCEYVMETAKSL